MKRHKITSGEIALQQSSKLAGGAARGAMSTLQSHLDVWDPAAVHAAKPADTCTAVGAEDAPQPLAAAEEGEGDGPASAFSFTLAVCFPSTTTHTGQQRQNRVSNRPPRWQIRHLELIAPV